MSVTIQEVNSISITTTECEAYCNAEVSPRCQGIGYRVDTTTDPTVDFYYCYLFAFDAEGDLMHLLHLLHSQLHTIILVHVTIPNLPMDPVLSMPILLVIKDLLMPVLLVIPILPQFMDVRWKHQFH